TILGLNKFLSGNKLVVSGHLLHMSVLHTGDTIQKTQTVLGGEPVFVIMDTSGAISSINHIKAANNYTPIKKLAGFQENIFFGGWTQGKVWGDTFKAPYIHNGGAGDMFLIKYGLPCDCDIAAPTADFSIQIDTSNRSVTLNYTGSVPVDSVRWQLGDGTSAKGNSITHQYGSHGVFDICAIAFNECDNHSKCTQIVFDPVCDTLVLAFTYRQWISRDPIRYRFTYTGTSNFDSILWDFGNGNSRRTTLDLIESFQQEDTYRVCVTVYNICEAKTYCQDIHIKEHCPPLNLGFDYEVQPDGLTVKYTYTGRTDEVRDFRWFLGEGLHNT